MKKSVSIAVLAAAAFFALTSCATNTVVAGTLAVMSEVAAENNMGTTAAVLSTASKQSYTALEAITPENEYYIGRAVAASVLSNYKVYNNPVQEAYLNKICRVITENSDIPELYNGYHVKMLDSTEVNAFATSGGHIFVTRGMLSCVNSEDALAAVLAHEVAHIQLGHSSKAIKASRWTTAVAETAGALTKSEMSSIMHETVSSVISNLVNSGYSQAQELDADAKALSLMAQAGYNPQAMTELLKKMESLQNGRSSGFYKTHPSPARRLTGVKAALNVVSVKADTSSARTGRFASIMK